LNEWQTSPQTDVTTTLEKQRPSTQLHFNDRVRQIVVEFAELVRHVHTHNYSINFTHVLI